MVCARELEMVWKRHTDTERNTHTHTYCIPSTVGCPASCEVTTAAKHSAAALTSLLPAHSARGSGAFCGGVICNPSRLLATVSAPDSV